MGIFLFKKVVIEDIVFIPVCTNLFYGFTFLIRKIHDYAKQNILLHFITITSILSILAWLWQTAGTGCQTLIVSFIILPAIIFMFVANRYKIRINYTHLYLTFIFICFVSVGWEVLNQFYLHHWSYNPKCDLLSKRGFFCGFKFHTSIVFGYTIAGFTNYYGSYMFSKSIK